MIILHIFLIIIAILSSGYIIGNLACSIQNRYTYPHASREVCKALLKSIRYDPLHWSGVDDNLDKKPFRFTINSNGIELWVCNGWSFLRVYSPVSLSIPFWYQIPIYFWYKKNKHLMLGYKNKENPENKSKEVLALLS